VRTVWAILGKDLLLEWRQRARTLSVVLFAAVTLLLFSFALGPEVGALRTGTPGFLVLALLLSSTLALNESFRIEREDRALEGLLLRPVDAAALFYAKALANTLLLALLGPVVVMLAAVLYSLEIGPAAMARLVLYWGLGAAGLAAPGTLYAAMTSRLKTQDVALPILLFPLVVPVLLGSVKSMDLVVFGDAMRQLRGWTTLLIAFDTVYWAVCGLLFRYAVEEGE
jgi:heme exporter protein B